MTFTTHRISVPVFDRMLASLDHVLGQGQALGAEKGVDEAAMLERRLAPDMFTLAQQVQRACNHAESAVARLADVAVPEMADPDGDFAAARARIAATRDFIASIDPARLEGDPDRPIVVVNRLGEFTFTAQDFLLHIAMPHFYFHVTTAFDILRAEGADIGKIDFLGAVMKDRLAARAG